MTRPVDTIPEFSVLLLELPRAQLQILRAHISAMRVRHTSLCAMASPPRNLRTALWPGALRRRPAAVLRDREEGRRAPAPAARRKGQAVASPTRLGRAFKISPVRLFDWPGEETIPNCFRISSSSCPLDTLDRTHAKLKLSGRALRRRTKCQEFRAKKERPDATPQHPSALTKNDRVCLRRELAA